MLSDLICQITKHPRCMDVAINYFQPEGAQVMPEGFYATVRVENDPVDGDYEECEGYHENAPDEAVQAAWAQAEAYINGVPRPETSLYESSYFMKGSSE